jgi:hypothetical protein
VTGAPRVAFSAELFPFASTPSAGALSDIGLTGSYRRDVGLESVASDGAHVDTEWNDFHVGVRARVRTGGARAPVVFGSVGYGETRFEFHDAPGPRAAELPGVHYRFLRLALDGRIPIVGPLAMSVGAAYEPTFSGGDVYDRFPRSTTGGAECGGGLIASLPGGFEAQAGAQYVRYFSKLSPEPGDRFVAGGALDELGTLQFGLAYAR